MATKIIKMSHDNVDNEMVKTRRARLRHWIDTRHKGKQVIFIASTVPKISQSEVSNLLKDKHFGEKRARSLEIQANMPAYYLDQAFDNQDTIGQPILVLTNEDDIPKGYTAIPEYDIDTACGDTADSELSYEQLSDGALAIYKDEWFEQQRVRKDAVKRFRCTGKSMFPIIRPRWRVAVNTDKNQLPTYTAEEAEILRQAVELPIYFIVDDGARKTKFVYIDTDTHEVVIESYNKDFKTERRDLEYAHNYIQVIGKVIDISGDPNVQ